MKVPHPTALGQVRPPETSLRYSQLSPSGSAFGASIARGLGSLGSALEVRAEALAGNRNQENRVKANGQLIAFQLEQDRVKDGLDRNAEGFSAIDEGYSAQYMGKADTILDAAPDQETREYLQGELLNIYGANMLKVQGLERDRNEKATDFALNSQFETARNVVRNDPGQLDAQVDKLSAAINGSVGVVPRESLRERIRVYLSGMAESAVQGRIDENPMLVLEELQLGTLKSGGTAALIYQESGGDPTIVNAQGYAGLYQMGAPRLAHLGVYTPGKDEDFKGWKENRWSGTFKIPGFPQVKTLNDFLANPDAQHATFQVHEAKMNEEIASNGFGKYLGQQVNGVLITTQGLYNMLHLGGVEGTRKTLAGETVRDANGTTVLSYAAMGSSAIEAAGGLNAVLSSEQKDSLLNQAEAAIRQRQADTGKAEDDAWQAYQREQSANYSVIQAGIARQEVGEQQLVEAASRGLISGEQFRVLRDDLRSELNEAGDDEAALELRTQVLRGEASVDEIMDRRDLSPKQRTDLVNLVDEVGRRDPILSRADVKRELDRIDSVIGGVRGPLAVLSGATSERVANALQEFSDRVQEEPGKARALADETIKRWRDIPVGLDSLPNISYWSGPKFGSKDELRQRLATASDALELDHTEGRVNETQYYRALKDLEQYLNVIESLSATGFQETENAGTE